VAQRLKHTEGGRKIRGEPSKEEGCPSGKQSLGKEIGGVALLAEESERDRRVAKGLKMSAKRINRLLARWKIKHEEVTHEQLWRSGKDRPVTSTAKGRKKNKYLPVHKESQAETMKGD